MYENQIISYDGILAQFQVCQLFNYQVIQVYVLVYVCVYIWSFYIQDTRTGTFTLIHCLLSLFIRITIIFTIISIITVTIVKYIVITFQFFITLTTHILSIY